MANVDSVVRCGMLVWMCMLGATAGFQPVVKLPACASESHQAFRRQFQMFDRRPELTRKPSPRVPLTTITMAAKQGKKARGKAALTQQLKRNEELHAKECDAMQKSFDARLPANLQRKTFAESDFKTFSVGEALLGENLNSPFKATGLIKHTVAPLFTSEECAAVVKEAEAYAEAGGGWGTQRHYSHPTTDVLLSELPEARAWFQEALPTKIFPLVADCFPEVITDPELLRIFDVFVVKYDSERQSYLSVHRDSSLISLTIALNPRSEFEGGGMWVEPLDQVVELDQGQVVTFASNIRHGGHRVTRGCRYILVGFLLYEGYVEQDRRLLEASQALRAEAKLAEAEAMCKEALALNPRRQEAWNNLGVLQRDMGRLQSAMDSFSQSLAIEPTYQEGWGNLAVCQSMAGEHDAAVATARKAVALNVGDGTSQYNLGCALAAQGETEGALRHLDSAIELNAADGEALHRRGQLRVEAGETARALPDLLAAVALLPRSAAVHNDLGVAMYEEGNVAEALEAFESAAVLDPSDQQAKENAVALREYLAAGGQA